VSCQRYAVRLVFAADYLLRGGHCVLDQTLRRPDHRRAPKNDRMLDRITRYSPTMNEPIFEADYSKFDSLECRESKKVWQYFGQRAQGIFVDVGANHPTEQSQTWFLELKGWSGVLIEPNSRLCQLLRAQRPASKTVQAACCAPEQVGEADLHIGASDAHSAINPQFDHALKGESERVKMRTLD